ncbi:AAA family ATPase [uncultured Sphingomonas sp.]|uniref:AAA family ATPase n=1 Tax=uncultured Sphingomonas sp. TaxID=158754 RepID=UPI0025D2DA82|nr:AAA family ATPase [uncultured Sphingomonas sp.]
MTNGMVIGRFLPLHLGHEALIRTAQALVDQLTVVVCATPGVWPDGVARVRWLLEMFPAARVVAIEAPPAEDVQRDADLCAWLIERLRTVQHGPVDCLFAANPVQQEIAERIGARFVLIDPEQTAVPVQSDVIRERPHDYWQYLPPAVRPTYARTICLHGPESTGKSTLAAQLAAHFETLFVPEYGRTYCEQFGRDTDMADLVTIGRTHAALTRAMLRQCNVRLILDTDPVMTAVWADMALQQRDPWFDRFVDTADLYLLLDIDMPFVDDGLRIYGQEDERRRFFDLSRRELERRGLLYRVIDGPVEERFGRALAAIAYAGL